MAFDDLRSFLQALDDQGQLLKISEEVNAEPDLAAAANATGRIGDGAPALWFDNIRGFTDARGNEHHRFLAEPRYLAGAAAEYAGEKSDRRIYSSLG
jgi:hypothetical protein